MVVVDIHIIRLMCFVEMLVIWWYQNSVSRSYTGGLNANQQLDVEHQNVLQHEN